jgi:predicted short-subunit dehydrogenase-like oxidoreductase (DUF2520 family)
MKFTKKDPIIIIGAGKISWSLVPSLIHAGYKIISVISRDKKAAKELAVNFDIKNYSDDPKTIISKKGIFILAVPDNKIKPVADKLAKLSFNFRNSLFIHLSGSQDISLLNNLRKKGTQTASFHIMQTFPSKKTSAIKNSFSAIETKSENASVYLFKLAENLELYPFRLNSRDKVIYHLAGVYASNFINAVLYQSQKLSEMLNLKKYNFNDIFAPLFFSTILNIKKSGPVMALSGPVERGDPVTVRKHISAIKQSGEIKSDILLSYLSLSLLLIHAAEEKTGTLNMGQVEIKKILKKELGLLKKHKS